MVFNRRFNEGTVLYKILIGYKLIFKILKATYVLNILTYAVKNDGNN